MLKVVVFDTGYGGEFFADQLAEELPVVEIIRVINWRDAKKITTNRKNAHKIVEESLRPYLNKVDLIIFANYYLTITSLKYFQRKYKKQRFLGLKLKQPDSFIRRDTLVLSVSPVSSTLHFHHFLLRLNRKTKVLNMDSWPEKIDDGELSSEEINQELKLFLYKNKGYRPKEVILASAQFNDIKTDLKKVLGQGLNIYDGFSMLSRETIKALNLRGKTWKIHKKVQGHIHLYFML